MQNVLLREELKNGQWERCLHRGADIIRLSRKQMERLLRMYPLQKGCWLLKRSDIEVVKLAAPAWDYAWRVMYCKVHRASS